MKPAASKFKYAMHGSGAGSLTSSAEGMRVVVTNLSGKNTLVSLSEPRQGSQREHEEQAKETSFEANLDLQRHAHEG